MVMIVVFNPQEHELGDKPHCYASARALRCEEKKREKVEECRVKSEIYTFEGPANALVAGINQQHFTSK